MYVKYSFGEGEDATYARTGGRDDHLVVAFVQVGGDNGGLDRGGSLEPDWTEGENEGENEGVEAWADHPII